MLRISLKAIDIALTIQLNRNSHFYGSTLPNRFPALLYCVIINDLFMAHPVSLLTNYSLWQKKIKNGVWRKGKKESSFAFFYCAVRPLYWHLTWKLKHTANIVWLLCQYTVMLILLQHWGNHLLKKNSYMISISI